MTTAAAIDLAAIAPEKGDKFSPNLHAWLKTKDRRVVVAEGGVYRLPRDPSVLRIGYIFDGEFIGSRLIAVMGNPRERMYCHSAWGPAEVVGFFDRYYAVGRCAVDPDHSISFQSREGRWSEWCSEWCNATGAPTKRTCRWCGIEQRSETYVVEKQRWVTVAPGNAP